MQNIGQGLIIGILSLVIIYGYSFNISTISLLEKWGIIDLV